MYYCTGREEPSFEFTFWFCRGCALTTASYNITAGVYRKIALSFRCEMIIIDYNVSQRLRKCTLDNNPPFASRDTASPFVGFYRCFRRPTLVPMKENRTIAVGGHRSIARALLPRGVGRFLGLWSRKRPSRPIQAGGCG